jgi:hypothetical protein
MDFPTALSHSKTNKGAKISHPKLGAGKYFQIVNDNFVHNLTMKSIDALIHLARLNDGFYLFPTNSSSATASKVDEWAKAICGGKVNPYADANDAPKPNTKSSWCSRK